ncbi:MAG: AAA family ATPase [Kiritimatiellae bacterium]|nr:AAA family ATPase [Kiritimatiellia bacterium]
MKPREAYRITAVRVVEFHNLGTTTIEIPEGGHLFLLGDNGSGKTTVLDAIHLVLTGGREMEFNAAARVAGAKDSGGRTIQGVVLRYNAVTGRTAREAGITYAAVELRSDAGRVCSLAVGLSASGMDVAFDRWGGIASAPVAELPLTIEENGRIRAATRGEFERGMKALQGGRYYAHNNEYADAVGARLFGGEAKYADVCKLLRTGKAYREIASRAANYDDLFRQLLEDPDRDTFEPLLKGLRELEDSKGRLDRIDERAQYLDELAGELARLGKLRLKEDLVSWAEADRSRSAAEREAVTIAGAESAARSELAAAESEAAARKADAARGRERLAELRAKDRTGLIDREKSAVQRLAEAERRTGEAESALADEKRCADAAEKALREAQMRRASALAKCADGLAAAGKSAGCAVGGVVDALRGADDAAESDFAGLFGPLRKELDREQSARHEADILARKEADAAADEVGRCRAELDAIRSRGENLPDVPGFAEVRAEIREKMLAARPLYELLEPASGCDTRHLALLERLAGDDFLATWLAKSDEADLVRQLAWRGEGPLTVAVRGDCDTASVNDLAPWLGSLVSFEESDPEAVVLLARHLSTKAGPSDGEFLGKKTWLFRGRSGLSPAVKPRLVGAKARKAEQERLERAAEDRLAEAERALKAAEKRSAACASALAALRKLSDAVENARETARREADAVRSASGEARLAGERRASAETMATERRRDVAAVREELEDVRIKMRAEGIDGSLEKRIAAAERTLGQRESECEAATKRAGAIQNHLDELAAIRAERERDAQAAAARAEAARSRFAAVVPAGTGVAEFAADNYPACMDEAADFPALREGLAKDAGAAEAKIEQRIRDPHGETYAFSFDKVLNAISDRRGTPLAAVIEEETRKLEELRGVFDQKSREVFERIFMGEVMRRLYLDWARIDELAKRIQRKLAGRRFGSNRYAFSIMPVPEYEAFVELVRKGYALDGGAEKDELRDYLTQHRDEILNAEVDAVPDVFDYRKWFRFELKVVTENEEGRVIDRKVKSLGSGGEQAVPNYLLILTVAEFLYHGGAGEEAPRTAPILFDEAFYGIDAARRDQLLAFADDLGLQLFVSSPDQDGVKREIRHSVSLIVIKDENLDVHLTPVVWRNEPTQGSLLGEPSPEPGMTVEEETK